MQAKAWEMLAGGTPFFGGVSGSVGRVWGRGVVGLDLEELLMRSRGKSLRAVQVEEGKGVRMYR